MLAMLQTFEVYLPASTLQRIPQFAEGRCQVPQNAATLGHYCEKLSEPRGSLPVMSWSGYRVLKKPITQSATMLFNSIVHCKSIIYASLRYPLYLI